MKPQNPLIEVTIYVWGDALDPANVSSYIGTEPSLSRRKGEKRTTRTHREIAAKTSVWTLTAETEAEDLSAHIQELASKVDTRCSQVNGVAGVEGAYVDIFVAVSADSDGGGKYDFHLSQQDICALQRIGLPVEFMLDVVKD
jgi:hypothetical protein